MKRACLLQEMLLQRKTGFFFWSSDKHLLLRLLNQYSNENHDGNGSFSGCKISVISAQACQLAFDVLCCFVSFGEYDVVLHKSRISEQARPADVLFLVHIIVISLITSIALISFHFRTFTFWFFIRASCTCSFHRILTSFLSGFFLLCPVFFLLGFITCSFNDIKNNNK